MLYLLCVFFLWVSADRVSLESGSTLSPPLGWTKRGDAPDSHGLELVFAIRQQNTQALEDALMAVSDPRSPRYGQHLTNEQVHALVAPLSEDIDAVTNFLAQHGITGVALTPNSDFIQADVTVAQAEELLQTTYLSLHHEESGAIVHRSLDYSLPAEVAAAVDFVYPTVHVPPPPAVPNVATLLQRAEALANTPKVLRDLYSVDVEGKAKDNNMAVTAFLEQYISLDDLHEFWNLFCGNITCGKGDPKLVGDATKGRGGVESMLDIQTITGVAGNVASEFWGFAGRSPDNKENEPFMKWLTQMSSTSDADVPKIFSSSYGEDEASWSMDAATRMNTEFQKAGARGISLLFASGDEGANCKKGRFVPETPGSSPWVTAVGGTYNSGKSAIGLSSGGFSDRWPQPSWQADAVKAYITSGDSNLPASSAGFNTSGRAYPDIAAQANDFTVVVDRVPLPGVAGTSCACPAASGVIAMINDERLQEGKSVLGFLNPWIYQNADKWNDITQGSNSGGQCGKGWPAIAGWDAVTGLGSPNYHNLVDA